MSTMQTDGFASDYGDGDGVSDAYYEEMSGIKQTEIDLLVPRIVDAQSRCHFLCVEFHDTAELIFAADSERYIRAVMERRENIVSSEIVEDWSDMNVFRYRRYWENPPTPQQQLLHDMRLKTVDSLRAFLDVQSDYPGAEEDTFNVVRLFLKKHQRNRKPTKAFLSFLHELLVAGEIEGVPETAANFVDDAKHGLQAPVYDAHFDDETLLRYRSQSIARFHQSCFVELTGIPARQIASLSQLTDALCGAGFEYEVDDRLYFLYLDALDDTVSDSAIRSVAMEIADNNPVAGIRKKAAQTLERLDWIRENRNWKRHR